MNIQVNDYKACKTLGSQAWCIVKEEKTFSSYIKYYKRQIISLNFNLPIENNESMIGFTVNINGKIVDSYIKNDKKTSEEIKKQFKFNSFSREKIKNILKEKNNQDAFNFICQYGLMDFYDEYINKEDVDPSYSENQPIAFTSYYGHLNVLNRLLEDPRVDPSADNNTAIRWSSSNGHFDFVKRLLEDPRVDPSADNNTAIRLASKYGHLNIVNCLLEDKRVCEKLDKKFIEKYLSEKQLLIYKKNSKNFISFFYHK